MKKILSLVISLFCLNFMGHAQDKAALEKRAQEMYDHAVKGNYELLPDYFHPKIFRLMTKEDFIAVMKNNDNEAHISVIVNVPPNFEFGRIKQIGNGYYCAVRFDRAMNFKLKDRVSKKERESVVDLYKNSTGSDEAYLDIATNTIVTKKRDLLIAVLDDETNGQWVF